MDEYWTCSALKLRKALNSVSKKAKLKKLVALPVAAILITVAVKCHVFGRVLYAFAVSSCFAGNDFSGQSDKPTLHWQNLAKMIRKH